MRYFLTSFLFASLLSSDSLCQPILAGQYNAQTDYYFNYTPNLFLQPPIQSQVLQNIDINGDSNIDFGITVYNGVQTQWGVNDYVRIFPLSSTEIAFGYIDSCFGQDTSGNPIFVSTTDMAKAFLLNDPVSSQANWLNDTIWLSWYEQSATVPNAIGHTCGDNPFLPTPSYVGVRLFNGNDTLYGWIYISYITNESVIIESYACNTVMVGVDNKDPLPGLEIFPNPANEFVTLYSPDKKFQHVSIYDVAGKRVKEINGEFTSLRISLEGLAPGLYFITAGDNPTETRKLVIAR